MAVGEHIQRRGGIRLPAACSVLVLATVLCAGLTGLMAHGRQGPVGSMAVAVAAMTCGLSGVAALVLAGMLSGTRWGVHGILAAGFIRFFLPLLVITASTAVQGPLSRAGLFDYMVIFFLIVLVVETLLLVGVLRAGEAKRSAMAWKGH